MTALRSTEPDEDRAARRELLLRRRLGGDDVRAPIPVADRTGPLPLSPGQERLWFLDALVPGSTEWVVPLVLRHEGRLDAAAVGRALDDIERRHESLRTRYLVESGEPRQVVVEPAGIVLDVVEDADVTAVVAAAQSVPFDLGSGRLLRGTLARGADRADWLVITSHHIACDGWSTDLLTRDVALCYAAERSGAPLPPAPSLQYADYASWAREHPPSAGDLGYWQDQLRDVAPLELPVDRPRALTRDASAARHVTGIDAAGADAVRDTARRHGTTPFTVLLAGYALMLSRRSGQGDVCIGTPVAGRTRSQLNEVVGYFANTLVLRSQLGAATSTGDLLAATRETVLAALAHQDVPFERLVSELSPERDLSRSPLADVLFVYEQVTSAGAGDGLPDLVEVPVPSASIKCDLILGVRDSGTGPMTAALDHATALFDADTVAVMADDWRRCVAFLCGPTSVPLAQLPLVTPAEDEWLTALAGARRELPQRPLHALIAEQAARTPDAVAVEDRDGALSYAELVDRAAELGARLAADGRPGLVGVCLERGTDLLVALVATLASGAAYLPLDPDHPRARLGELIESAGPDRVVTNAALHDRLPAGGPRVELVDEPGAEGRAWNGADPHDLAYVLHTSGSTGKPKGVMVSHRGIVNRLLWMQETYRLAPGDRVLQKTPTTFDVSVWELFWPLLVGATVVFAPPGMHLEPARLTRFMHERGVTHLHFVPSMLDLFLDLTSSFPGTVRDVFCSGEALRAGTVRRLAERSACRVHNLYGPTEASVDVSAVQIEPAAATDPLPIGHAVDNTALHVLDPMLRRVPRGVVGEIYLAGVQLARGYLHRPDLTADRFVPDPFEPGARMYRTGDRGYIDRQGAVVYVGRADAQVKIRGVRVEPGEVEASILAHPGVTGACVCVARDGGGDPTLVGYVTASGPLDDAALRESLAARLPGAFVPPHLVQLPAFPTTSSGKADRDALAGRGVPQRSADERGPGRTPDPVEQVVLRVFETVLGRDGIGVDESFFAVGGDSMRAVRAVAALGARGLNVSVADLFRGPSAGQLARLAGGERRDDVPRVAAFAQISPAARAAVPAGVVDMYPLSQIQAGMIFEMLGDADVLPYHNVTSYPVRDEHAFDAEAFERAALRVARRHEVLRTSVDLVGFEQPMQLVHAEAVVDVGVRDLRHLAAGAASSVVDSDARDQLRDPFTLDRAPLWRLRVHVVSDTDWWLTEVECHVVLDGWSHNMMVAELLRTYRAERAGTAADDAPPRRRFADYVAAEHRVLADPAARQYWGDALGDVAERVLVPGWGAVDAAEPVATVERDVAALARRVADVARDADVPVKTVYLAAAAVAVEAHSGAVRPVLGVVSQGRSEGVGGDDVFGMFLNTLPFVAPSARTSWRALLADVLATETEMLAHRRYPLTAVVQSLGRTTPLVEVSVNYLDFYTVDDGTVDLPHVVDHSPNEFPLVITSLPGRLQATVHTHVLSPERAAALLATVERVLSTMCTDPDGDATVPAVPAWDVTTTAPVGEDAAPEPVGAADVEADVAEAVLGAMARTLVDVVADELDLDSDFLALGGHSLTAMRMAALLQAEGLAVTPRDIVTHRTAGRIAAHAQDRRDEPDPARPIEEDDEDTVTPTIPDPVVWLDRTGPDRPWVFLHPGGGGVHWYRELARLMPAHVPVAGLQSPAVIDPVYARLSVAELGRAYVRALDAHSLGSRVNLLGWCGGTAITWELSRQMLATGRDVGVFLLDPGLDALAGPGHEPPQLPALRRCEDLLARLAADPGEVGTWPEIAALLRLVVDDERSHEHIGDKPDVGWLTPVRMWRELAETRLFYEFPPLDAPVHLILGEDVVGADDALRSGHTLERYLELFRERLVRAPSVHRVAGSHYGVLRPPHVSAFAALITRLAAADDVTTSRRTESELR